MGEFTNARPDLRLTEYARRRIRASYLDGVPLKTILRIHRTSAVMVARITADLPPRSSPPRKRQAPHVPRDV